MRIHQSAEDYLEKILMIREKKGEVHSIDIANELGFSKPSVSVAMKNLRQAGYISMDGNGAITLEPPGYEIANRIYQRHKLLTRLLISLGVSAETAEQDACRIEHDLSVETFEKLQAYVLQHFPEE